eukprot:289411-Alexandrium_andersonii.AAC.1
MLRGLPEPPRGWPAARTRAWGRTESRGRGQRAVEARKRAEGASGLWTTRSGESPGVSWP